MVDWGWKNLIVGSQRFTSSQYMFFDLQEVFSVIAVVSTFLIQTIERMAVRDTYKPARHFSLEPNLSSLPAYVTHMVFYRN